MDEHIARILRHTIYGKHYSRRVKNVISLIRKKGKLICPNSFELSYCENNKYDIEELFDFCTIYGVIFSKDNGFWHYNDKIIETPNGIRFYVDKIRANILAETFVYDTHFTCFDLRDKVVVQAGGYIGDTALYYALRGAKIYSFEPNLFLFKQALENIGLNPTLLKNITMKNYAIGKDEDLNFPLDENWGRSSLYRSALKTMKVRSVSISSILREFEITDPFLLDLDLVGNEFRAIEDIGTSNFNIVRIKYYTSIINGMNLTARDEIMTKLKEYGFKEFRIFNHNKNGYDLHQHGIIEAKR